MLTDFFLIGLLVVFGILGWRTGTIKQITHWAGIALGRAVAQPLALVVTLMLVKDYGFLPLSMRISLSVFYFFAFYVLGTMIAGFFLKRFIAHRVHTRYDRTGGFFLGMGKGAAMIFVVLSFFACFRRSLAGAFGTPHPLIGNSLIVSLVGRNNFFGGTPVARLARLSRLMDAARDPKEAKLLAADPDFQEVLSDPKLMATLKDDELAEAIKNGKWFSVQKDPRVAMLLDDPKMMGILSDPLDWGEE